MRSRSASSLSGSGSDRTADVSAILYRSTQIILDAASGVISRNRERQDKHLWTEREGGDPVLCHRAHDELEEADFIVAQLRRAIGGGNEHAAVLYRTNAQSRAIEDALTREGIPYRIVGNVRFYERKEIKDALSYLPRNNTALATSSASPNRFIGTCEVKCSAKPKSASSGTSSRP